MRQDRTRTPSSRISQRRQVWVYCSIGMLVVALSAAVVLYPLQAAQTEQHRLQTTDALLVQTGTLRTAAADFQIFIDPHLTSPVTPGPVETTALANGAVLAQDLAKQVSDLEPALVGAGLPSAAALVKSSYTPFAKSLTGLTPLASGTASPSAAALAESTERYAFQQVWSSLTPVVTQLRQQRDTAAQAATDDLVNSRRAVLLLGSVVLAALFGIALVAGHRARRRELQASLVASGREFESTLLQALEMSKAEPAVFNIMKKALQIAVPARQVELLVANSGHTHFHQALSTDVTADARAGCGVISPHDCPASASGHALMFKTSGALNACPYLQDRVSGPCSAICVPVSIAGKAVGVLHATGPDMVAPTDVEVGYLEVTSHRASERLTLLRAFAESETEARSDPLTGLWNRRSLRSQVVDLQRDDTPYALAYLDLDHFKDLNDTYGHDAGDHALRLFSRVLRDALRPDDSAVRYGGEEFVIVLPNCTTDAAVDVLERVRSQLAASLAASQSPPFTASYGLASSANSASFDAVVTAADQALLSAKAAGRDRIVVASPAVVIPRVAQ